MAQLITVPSMIYDQEYETPIQVNYYNGSIELVQNGESVLIHSDEIDKFFREIKRHRPEAEAYLEKRNV